mgnify:CR=1 FL=1
MVAYISGSTTTILTVKALFALSTGAFAQAETGKADTAGTAAELQEAADLLTDKGSTVFPLWFFTSTAGIESDI